MVALHTESIGRGLTGSRELPAAAVAELETRAGLRARPGYIPCVIGADLFREIQRHGPAAERGGACVGDTHVQLEKIASGIGRRRAAGIRGESMHAAQQQSGQQQRQFNKRFHMTPSFFKILIVLVREIVAIDFQ